MAVNVMAFQGRSNEEPEEPEKHTSCNALMHFTNAYQGVTGIYVDAHGRA